MIFFSIFSKKVIFILFFHFKEKYYVSNTLRTKNISNFATPKISEIVFIHYKQK